MEMAWVSSPDFESIYLEIKVSDQLGVLVTQEGKEDVPRLIFCSLFPDPVDVYFEGRDKRDAGLTIEQVKELLTSVETALERRPFR